MNSWSSAESGPDSSMPAGRAGLAGAAKASGGPLAFAAPAGTGRPRSWRRGADALLLAQPLQLGAVLLVVGLELDQHVEDRGRLLEAARGHVGLDHLAVGLGHQHVVLRLAVELDQLGQALEVLRVALHDLLQQSGGAVDLAPLHQLVDHRQQLVERLVVASLGEVDLAELLARVLVARVALQQRLEHAARVVAAGGSRGRPRPAAARSRGRPASRGAPPRAARSRARSPSGRCARAPPPRAGGGCAAPSAATCRSAAAPRPACPS